ncbi:MAG: STAS/SEC14 domain-containing protein [Rufibacter sp.]
MIELINTENPEVFAVRVSGTLGKEEYDLLVPALESQIQQQGKINLYWEMSHFEGWSPGGLWEDLKFDAKHVNSFGRIALVGDQKWEQWLTQLMKPFTTAQVKFFETDDHDAAKEWVGL